MSVRDVGFLGMVGTNLEMKNVVIADTIQVTILLAISSTYDYESVRHICPGCHWATGNPVGAMI